MREMIIVPHNNPFLCARYFPYSIAFITGIHQVDITIIIPTEWVFVESPLKL